MTLNLRIVIVTITVTLQCISSNFQNILRNDNEESSDNVNNFNG